MGLSIGTLVLPPSPSWFRRMIKAQKEALDRRCAKKETGTPSSNEVNTPITSLSSPRQTGKISTELCAYALLWSILCVIVEIMELGVGANNKEHLGKGLGKSVSRQMVDAYRL
jgi:phosphatidylinositol glycan class W